MSVETLQRPEAPLPEQWQRAIDRSPLVVEGLDPQASQEEITDIVGAIKDRLEDFADSESLKVVSYTDDAGEVHRSIEPSWSETNGFGLPVDTFASLMGLDTAHAYKHGDLADGALLGELADATQKPVSAVIDGRLLDPVTPHSTKEQ